MRAVFVTFLATAVAATSAGGGVLWPARAMAADESPEVLYKEGKKAYRLGRYGEAVEKFEKAYDLSDNAVLLYNIGLAYKNWYDVSKNIEHLRKAKAVFQNFYLEAQRDSSVGDPVEAEAEIKQVEQLLAAAEEEERERAAAEAARKDAEAERKGQEEEAAPVPQGPDPGKKLRLGGIIGMSVGGAAVIGGGVVGVIFGLRGQEFADELRNLRAQQEEMGCGADSASSECTAISADIDTTKSNGRKANILMVVSLGVIGGLGLAGVATGTVLFLTGNKRTKAWQQGRKAQLRVSPTLGGLVVQGRF
jgi:tetratricopeptide (TPR) repeat protein